MSYLVMKNFHLLFASAFCALMFSCSALEARKDVDVHVYCQQDKYRTELKLYINDTFKGNIPFSPEKYTCRNPAPKGGTLDLNLGPGNYKLTVTSPEGAVVSGGMLLLSEDNMELVGQAGGMDVRQSEQCMYIEIL